LPIATMDVFKAIQSSTAGIAVAADGRMLLESGGYDRTVHVHQLSSRIDREAVAAGDISMYGEVGCELTQQLCQHRKNVHLIAVDKQSNSNGSGNGNTLFVSASHDSTCVVWEIIATAPQAFGLALPFAESISVNPIPRHVLRGHTSYITAVGMNVDLDICVSASADGTILMHSLHTGFVLHKFKLKDCYKIDEGDRTSVASSTSSSGSSLICQRLCITPSGDMIFYSHLLEAGSHPLHFQLAACNINLRYWRYMKLQEQCTALRSTPDGRLVACGSRNGLLTLHRVYDLQSVQRFERAGSSISAITFTKTQEYMFIGTNAGHMLIYAVKC